MSTVALVLLLIAAAVPLTLVPLRRSMADPVLPVAATAALCLGIAALLAAEAEAVTGTRLAAALVLGVAAATTAGSPVVRAAFRLMRREFLPWRAPASAPLPAGAAAESSEQEVAEPGKVLRGGAWIGYLERAAVTATVLAGWPEGIALVLAVKGVGRYAELRQPDAPEAFIIGTLSSLLWAAAAAGTVTLLR